NVAPDLALLADIRQIFAQSGCTRLTTKQLVDSLCAASPLPLDGRGIKGEGNTVGRECRYSELRNSHSAFNWLALRLRPLGIVSHNIRLNGSRAKGYDLSDFTDAFAASSTIPPSHSSYPGFNPNPNHNFTLSGYWRYR